MAQFYEVLIHGRTLRLKVEDGQTYAQELASYLEETMSQVMRSSGVPASDRVAMMAALSILDELFQLRRQVAGQREAVNRKVTQLIEASDRLLQQ